MYEELLALLIKAALTTAQTAAKQRDRDADALEDKAIQKRLNVELKKDKPNKQKITRLKKQLDTSRICEILTTPSAVVAGILGNHKTSSGWAKTISFADSPKSRQLTNIYINLDLFAYPLRVRISDSEDIPRFSFSTLLERAPRHVILLGEAGSGKTTSMKFLFRSLIQANSDPGKSGLPLVLRFRDIGAQASRAETGGSHNTPASSLGTSVVLRKLIELLGLELRFDGRYKGADKTSKREESLRNVLFNLLDTLELVLILDGFDELPSHAAREIALGEIRSLALHLQRSCMIVTCRTGEFNYTIENAEVFQIAPLSDVQIVSFARKWLGDVDADREFLAAVQRTPFGDTAMKPLSLAHLCAIYERTGRIPDKPKTVYRKVVYLMLEEWDEQWSVERHSKYAGFFPDRKADFLAALAFQLTTHFGVTSFSRQQLQKAYLQLHESFDLPENEMKDVVNEIESHTGLFLQTGFDLFEFAHKSLQEYLTAEYLVKLPYLSFVEYQLKRLPNELAIATSLSSDPSGFLAHLVLNILVKNQCPIEFYQGFTTRVVQEAPEFSPNDAVCLALPVLAALWACNGRLSSKSRVRSIPQELVHTYSRFVSKVLERDAPRVLGVYYVRDEESCYEDWIRFRRAKRLDGFRLPTTLWLPSALVEALNRANKAMEATS